DVVYSEMISVDALAHNSAKTLKMLEFSKKEKPIVIQLFGKKPELFALAAKLVEKKGADGIDINFGCPAPKVFKASAGASLMKDLDLCYEITKATCLAVKIPVSIKIRSSVGKVIALDLVKKIRGLPVQAIMVHGRSYSQGFSGEIDFAMIKKVKQNFSGLVLGNGGIVNPQKAKEMLDKTQVDGIGLAQGVLGKPWLFKQVKDYLKTGKFSEFDFTQIKKTALEHAALNYKLKGKQGILEIRKHLAWYFRGFTGASDLRQKLIKVNSFKEIKSALAGQYKIL
ncbi:MAG: tRNA-dihydrouridine synthase, partial [Candidatus Parcubacteria bacterium]|nr:tRNA-dihydrouridine synthase [Candidatus Parcubacteria bacterium]